MIINRPRQIPDIPLKKNLWHSGFNDLKKNILSLFFTFVISTPLRDFNLQRSKLPQIRHRFDADTA
ncbi:MAG: hypothetical protein CVV64_03725 [Candidatus Wallbacteria bacterium HGW-Wallbacteria-1]|uniref:Uncharacterized protein n=1 Tax=Candidatus Wallbacteria bacterium HGW-Wallbacteria-1 TaxID=2013854 RepID=A0A2N1PTV6_9BACT|nr:MAG: hypothetical protein CVV64_03725 [Candidatus Wallbacteria bacterium HGW-Wallbacteria-1]